MSKSVNIALAAAMMTGLAAGAAYAAPAELRFACTFDGNECEVLSGLLKKYEAAHPDVKIVVDQMSYKASLQALPVQLAGGNGPDFAAITDLGGYSRYYLDLTPYVDVKYFNDNFGDMLNWYRSNPDDKGIYGLQIQLTVSGAWVNKTLFDQANVALPQKGATWDDWVKAANEVAKATGTPYPMALDRSGHRIAGPVISYGGKIFGADGAPILVDDGFKAFAKNFIAWNKDGTMARDVWAGQGGDSYRDASQEFINGQLVFYFSGSWQTTRFDAQIGDAFDWVVVPEPCGPVACSPMPGGAGMVGFKHTKHPEIVGDIINFISKEENYSTFSSLTRNVPAHKGLAAKGIVYEGATKPAQEALAAWTAQIPQISPIAYAYQGYKNNRAMFNIGVQRITQVIVGELSFDDAMERAKADLADMLKQAK